MKKKYRCTRNTPYPKGSAGYEDLSTRQGYYVFADNPEQAQQEMTDAFPLDTAGFTVQLIR